MVTGRRALRLVGVARSRLGLVPGVGVEPTQARGARDFKAPGRGRLTKDLSNSLPFSRSYGQRSRLQSEDYEHPDGHLFLELGTSCEYGASLRGAPMEPT